jgi:hypothetical protein
MQEARELAADTSTDYTAAPLEVRVIVVCLSVYDPHDISSSQDDIFVRVSHVASVLGSLTLWQRSGMLRCVGHPAPTTKVRLLLPRWLVSAEEYDPSRWPVSL